MRRLVQLAALALALPAAACETFSSHTCDTTVTANPPVTYSAGKAEGGVYQSSAWDGDLLWFPGGMIYRLEHHLTDAESQPEVPRWVSLWVSAAKGGVDAGGVVRATANEAVIVDVGPTTVSVQNQGCQDYWLLVTAGTGATQPPPPPGP